jgi:type VI secretion system protein ImpG
MDPRFLAYYERELGYVRGLGGEFAQRFPKIAGRLGLDKDTCADPYVERLLEGFAFLAARVQLKIDAEFPRLTQSLLSITVPHLVAPTPSMAVVQLHPNPKRGSLSEGFRIARGSTLKATAGRGDVTACEYRTAHEVELWPIELVQVAHTSFIGDLGHVKIPSRRTLRGALRLRFRTLGGAAVNQLALERLPLFLRGPEPLGMRLYELLCAGNVGLCVRSADGRRTTLAAGDAIRPMGFDDAEALLPYTLASFQGYRLLHEYFALPSRYLFVELSGIRAGLAALDGTEFELVVLLDRHEPDLEARMLPEHFALHCTPVVNLFPKRADRIHLSDGQNEHHVVVDRTRPLDFEVHSVTEVVGFGAKAATGREFLPFYASNERHRRDSRAYYTLHREPRLQSARREFTQPRSTYAGSEVFLSLVDGDEGPYAEDVEQLGVSVLASNRDLPLLMSLGVGRTDFTLEGGAPVESIRCLSGPSEPRESPAWGASAWRLVSHLSLNQLSLTNQLDALNAAPLRELLELYADLGARSRQQIAGVRSVQSASVVRRLPLPGPTSFARGLEITLDFDETAFEGRSAFLLSAVLDRFFARYVAINSFTETVLRTPQRGEVMRWPTKLGRRSIA